MPPGTVRPGTSISASAWAASWSWWSATTAVASRTPPAAAGWPTWPGGPSSMAVRSPSVQPAAAGRSCAGRSRCPRRPDRGPAQPPGSVAWLRRVRNALVLEYPGRVGGGLSPALHAQLGEQGRYIVLDRLLGEEEALADLPVGQALADQLQDLLFLLGEPGQRIGAGRLVTHPLHHPAGRLRVQHGLT